MKSKDLTTLIIVGVVSAVLSIVISSKIFVPPSQRQQSVIQVPSISSDFPTAGVNKYLNNKTLNPTVTVQIGNQPIPGTGTVQGNGDQ